MADMLCTADDLLHALQIDAGDISTDTATLWIQVGTAIVQAAADGQRIVRVSDDEVDVLAPPGQWLRLPQRPVAQGDVSAVSIDGVAVTDYVQVADRLWRRCGWSSGCAPVMVHVVYSHGYADQAQELQLARGAVVGLAQAAAANPDRVRSEGIDDYRVTRQAMEAQLDAAPLLRRAIRRMYGRRAGMVTL